MKFYEDQIKWNGLTIYFKAEEPDNGSDFVDWVILRIQKGYADIPFKEAHLHPKVWFTMLEVDNFERSWENTLDKLITDHCLKIKEKNDETFALRNV